MNQKITKDSIRVAPLALALVLLVVLGLMALSVHAQEGTDTGEQLPNDLNEENITEREALFSEQAQERKENTQQAQEERQGLEKGSATQEDMQSLRNEQQEKSRAMLQEHSEERKEMFSEQKGASMRVFEERRSGLRERLEERKREREKNISERKGRFEAKVQARLQGFVERMVNRMNTAAERLEQITTRVESRIDKMEEKGGDVTDARAALQNRYALIEDTRGYITLLSEVSVDTITSDDPKGQKEEIRKAATLVKDSMKEVHQMLREVVQNMKASISETVDPETDENDDAETEQTE